MFNIYKSEFVFINFKGIIKIKSKSFTKGENIMF